MNQPPDLTHFYAIHRKMRIDTRRYAKAVEMASSQDRAGRLTPLTTWAQGFAHELEEHHFVEDTYFFPELAERIPSAGAVLEGLAADHRVLDDILGRWSEVACRLADPKVPFAGAKDDAMDLAMALRDLLQRHLDIEDQDVLSLYTRHYTANDYDAVYQRAIDNSKKKGLTFVVPWNVLCLDERSRQALLDVAPLPLKLVWWLTRRRFERLESSAFAGVFVETADLAPQAWPSDQLG